jgi:hypothetical protein
VPEQVPPANVRSTNTQLGLQPVNVQLFFSESGQQSRLLAPNSGPKLTNVGREEAKFC